MSLSDFTRSSVVHTACFCRASSTFLVHFSLGFLVGMNTFVETVICCGHEPLMVVCVVNTVSRSMALPFLSPNDVFWETRVLHFIEVNLLIVFIMIRVFPRWGIFLYAKNLEIFLKTFFVGFFYIVFEFMFWLKIPSEWPSYSFH